MFALPYFLIVNVAKYIFSQMQKTCRSQVLKQWLLLTGGRCSEYYKNSPESYYQLSEVVVNSGLTLLKKYCINDTFYQCWCCIEGVSSGMKSAHSSQQKQIHFSFRHNQSHIHIQKRQYFLNTILTKRFLLVIKYITTNMPTQKT